MLNYEIEDASKALAIIRSLKKYRAPFRIVGGYRLIDNGIDPEATVQIEARGKVIHEASNGAGPVDSLKQLTGRQATQGSDGDAALDLLFDPGDTDFQKFIQV